MKIGAAFPGQYLKAADLGGKRVAVIIEDVQMEDIGGETKPIITFKGKERGLVLNRTNSNSITMIVGSDETTEWVGKRITLYPSKTDFQGKRVDCIRIDPPQNPTPQSPLRKPAPPPEPDPEADNYLADDDSDSVPF